MTKIYVGPYVRVRVPIQKLPDYEYWCTKCDKRRGDTSFCCDCGEKVSLKETLVRKPPIHWSIPAMTVLSYAVTDYEAKMDDHAFYVYTIGNGRTDFRERLEDEGKLKAFWFGAHWLSNRGAIDLSQMNQQEQIKSLQQRCCAEVESIADVFGEENVGFGWGVVTVWN